MSKAKKKDHSQLKKQILEIKESINQLEISLTTKKRKS